MKMIRRMLTAFSIYSRIPVPHFQFKEEDMKYVLCFLPVIGVVTGALFCAALYLSDLLHLPLIAKVCLASLVPLLVTGGFHVDGFLDVTDAVRSYKSKEEKLEILKDPHIGAFAVISFAVFSLVWIGSLAVISDREFETGAISLAALFILSRAGCGLTSILLKKAKDDGMLKNETSGSDRKEVLILLFELIVCILVSGIFDVVKTLVMTAVLAVFCIYYRHGTYREFGGVTGDTAGYFVCMCELAEVFSMAVYYLIKT